jgi:hypothetical protein
MRVLRWIGQEWIERVVAYVIGLPFHHTIVYERINTTWTILGTSEVSHAAVVEMDPSGDRHVRSGGRCRDLRTPMAASSLRPSFCLHGNPNTTTSAEWIRHTHRPSHQSTRIVVSLQSKLQQIPPAMDRDRRYVCSPAGVKR